MVETSKKMVKRLTVSGNTAVALAVKQLDVDVVAAYPITPSTTVVEAISEYVANGEIDAEFIPVESEHSALSALVGAAAAGARTFTATASQGLLLMHEVLFMASSLRLPIVMAIANRAVSAPLNIWNDQGDVMPQRDSGWIQLFVETGQEAYDRVIQAYRVAEDPRVRLPVMVNFDGVVLTHTYAPLETLSTEAVQAFAPKLKPPFRLDPDNPLTIGAVGNPDYYYEARYQAAKALEASLPVVEAVDRLYAERTGRGYGLIEPYMMEDAEYVLLALGSVGGTIKHVVRRLRKEGLPAGFLSLKLWRPFPAKHLLKLLQGVKALGVVEKSLSPGAVAQPVLTDIAALLHLEGVELPLVNFVAGLGGRDIRVGDVELMFRKVAEAAETKPRKPVTYVGLRGGG
jgi:pyruvate ferredoxin oxidoreductase alpha subunit